MSFRARELPDGGVGDVAHIRIPSSRDRGLAGSAAAIALVAGIYVHFLLFAQFGFLQGIRAAGYAIAEIHRVLGTMAFAGVASSVLAAVALRNMPAKLIATAGMACAAGAGLAAALVFRHIQAAEPILLAIALLTGAGLGMTTVAAAVLLRNFTGGAALGRHIGLGTGLAYLICNVPAIFEATPSAKGWISAAAAAAALLAAALGRSPRNSQLNFNYAGLAAGRSVALATLGFLALVWFDSAAFTAVQNAPMPEREILWGGSGTLWAIGAVHALAAFTSGVLIDRGALRSTLAIAFGLLILGHVGFSHAAQAHAWAALVYVAGVSLYSTTLAAFATLGPADQGIRPPWRAAWIYAIAGWIGSGAGVGLAEQYNRVPLWAAPAAATMLAIALIQLRPSR